MASPALSVMRAEGQLLVQDTSTVGAGLSNANWTTLINLALRWFYDNTEKRIKIVGLYVTGTPAAGATEVSTDAAAIYPEIIDAYITTDGAAQATATIMDRMGYEELRYRQKVSATQARPTHWAAVKRGGQTGATTPIHVWYIALWPIPDADYDIYGTVRDYPTALSGDTDVVELGDHEARIVTILASILAAPLLGRQDLVDGLVNMLPKMLQDKLTSFVTHDEVKTLEAGRG